MNTNLARAFGLGSLALLAVTCFGITSSDPESPAPFVSSPPATPDSALPHTEEPEPEEDVTRPVHPGSFCSDRGGRGTYRGRAYACRGPGDLRWRRA